MKHHPPVQEATKPPVKVEHGGDGDAVDAHVLGGDRGFAPANRTAKVVTGSQLWFGLQLRILMLGCMVTFSACAGLQVWSGWQDCAVHVLGSCGQSVETRAAHG